MRNDEQKLRDYWQQRTPREQKVLLFGGIAIIFFIFYAFFWSPWLTHINSMRSRIITDGKTLVWMQTVEKELLQAGKKSPNKSQPLSLLELLTELQQQLLQLGLNLNSFELKQINDKQISLHLQKIEFDQFMRLLIDVMQKYQINIEQINAVADNSPGVVNADVILILLS